MRCSMTSDLYRDCYARDGKPFQTEGDAIVPSTCAVVVCILVPLLSQSELACRIMEGLLFWGHIIPAVIEPHVRQQLNRLSCWQSDMLID